MPPTGGEIGEQDGFFRRQDRRRFRHEMNAAEDDDVGLRLRGFTREPERVADEVRDVLDLGALVVVRENDGVATLRQRFDIALQLGDDFGRGDLRTARAHGSKIATSAER